MTEEDSKKTKKGFLARLREMSDPSCDCGCCGGMKIVPKEKTEEEQEEGENTQ
ncbi:MAG: hypothetical protein Q7J09_10320 [Methanocalculus sp.]|uniref:hypothetical protein n=1 Tax=Methanocalculus sp. TaxID=2004547 RepID=UPI0027282FB8|nr:hypothetical protein [Methanocalculus sp.]MDO9540379.1 hypothetical protein [Methanocalculus sp.]